MLLQGEISLLAEFKDLRTELILFGLHKLEIINISSQRNKKKVQRTKRKNIFNQNYMNFSSTHYANNTVKKITE